MCAGKNTGIKPILLIDKLEDHFGTANKKSENKTEKITPQEEILLTLIANVIVEIIISKEL